MEIIAKAAWLSLGLIHIIPTLVLFRPELAISLYGIDPKGDVGILIIHRGAIFLAIMITMIYAAFDPDVRKLATIVAAISIVGFVFVYTRAGFPAGALRKVVITDMISIAPLSFVIWHTWRTEF